MPAPAEVSPYAAAHARRLRESRARDQQWCTGARQEAVAAARVLLDRFGAHSVLLFGSVARGDGRPGSDIDLLVAGVPPARWFDACAAAADVVRCGAVDLVPADLAHQDVLERARAEGIALHG